MESSDKVAEDCDYRHVYLSLMVILLVLVFIIVIDFITVAICNKPCT